MKRKLQVFVSSTYTDLIEERQAAVQAILKAGHIPAGMELFTASDKSQWDTIKRWIDESDCYMLILGGRYGSVDPVTKVSYTEMEFDYASEIRKPMFSVVIRDDALDEKVKIHGRTVIEQDHQTELKLFREKVLTKISSFFRDERDIKLAVHESLGDLRDNPDLAGWVSGNDIEDPKPLHAEIARLNDEVTKLSTKAPATSKTNRSKQQDDVDFDDLVVVLKGIEVTMPEWSQSGVTSVNLLTLLVGYADSLITGVFSSSTGNVSKFLYYNVCPKLSIHGLVENEKPAGVYYRRSYLSERGKKLIAHLQRRNSSTEKTAE
ncbi:DUF4062 domain-containing protein [Rhizobium leguminosarum]|uniref:DUF4062 domain-containing protein n=1 Tax=Rhizobium leguminosarum TaxID=384 RepID=UPI0036D89B03